MGCGTTRPPNPLGRPNVGSDFFSGVLIAAPLTPRLVFFIGCKNRAKVGFLVAVCFVDEIWLNVDFIRIFADIFVPLYYK